MSLNNVGKKKYKIITKFMLYYILVLIIPVVMSTAIHRKTIDLIEKNSIESNISHLRQSVSTINARMNEIEIIARRLQWNPKLRRFMYVREPFRGKRTYQTLLTRKELYDYTMTNNFILDYYVFFKNSNLVLASDRTYKIDDFYENCFKYHDINFNEWYDLLFSRYNQQQYLPEQKVTICDKTYTVITYIQSIGYPKASDAVASILIDNNAIRDTLKGINIEDGGWAYIVDKQGNIITYMPSFTNEIVPVNIDFSKDEDSTQQYIGGNKMLVTHKRSDYNDWFYVVVQPYDVVMEKAIYIKKITFVVILITLIVGAFIALFLSYRTTKPVVRIMQTLNKRWDNAGEPKDDAFEYIHNIISSLIKNNEVLDAELKKQRSFVTNVFFARLLKGDFGSELELKALMDHIDIHLGSAYYRVAILYINGYGGMSIEDEIILKELDMKRVIAKEVTQEFLSVGNYIYQIDEHMFSIIFSSDSSDIDVINDDVFWILENIRVELESRYKIEVVITVGNIYNRIIDLSFSYSEAMDLLSYAMREASGGIVYHGDIPQKNSLYYYPKAIENKLESLGKSGNLDEAVKILKEIYKENIIKRWITNEMLKVLAFDMYATVIRIREELNIYSCDVCFNTSEILNNVDNIDRFDMFYDMILEEYHEICDEVHKRKKSYNTNLSISIKDYVDSNFDDYSMSLAVVADKFNLSEVYLSQFFKEQMGVNFSTYIENIRMTKAKEYLSDSTFTIGEISRAVGYNSSSAFSRAFKRLHGITPTEYRANRQI